MSVPDRVEKHVRLRAPPARVWRAVSDHVEFGRWFGVTLDGPFVPGAQLHGTFGELPPQQVLDDELKKAGLAPAPVRAPPPNVAFCTVERVDPPTYLSFRWIPFGIDAAIDFANEPTTLVEFAVAPDGDGTLLTIVESGFDRVPAHRRERAFRMNDGGWAAQLENVRKHVEAA
jgi:uncharacterized protein YndB with AHSA1/START domain